MFQSNKKYFIIIKNDLKVLLIIYNNTMCAEFWF